jgi:hypothetical protein
MGSLVLPRALQAARGNRENPEPFPLDTLAAVHAFAEGGSRKAFAGRLSLAQFAHMAVNECRADVRQLVGHGLVSRIPDGARQVAVMLLVGIQQQPPDFVSQVQDLPFQQAIEFRDL